MNNESPTDPSLEEVLDEQSRLWKNGTPTPVEEHLLTNAVLKEDEEAVLDLIYNEYRLREEAGCAPPPELYLQRFSKYADRLAPMLELHQALWKVAVDDLAKEESESPSERDTLLLARVPPSDLNKVIGKYELLGELGSGSMGKVYMARDRNLDRTVALKMILAGVHASREELARFRTEAETIAHLFHPNILQIHDIGEHEGMPYLALEYVSGCSLAQYLRGGPQPPGQAAQLVRVLAQAMQEAHKLGVVHRDLKPANVLLNWAGDLPFALSRPLPPLEGCTPKISDFGLAKRLDRESGQTLSGAVVGTPSYMAPEQAAARQEIGPAADVYALGVILYEMLTGHPPFRGETMMDTLRQVIHNEPVSPTRLQPKVPRDLDTICLKCLSKEPNRRYASAGDLAEDLRRFLANEPIHARRSGPLERLSKWVRRSPVIAGLSGMLLLVAVIAVVLVTWGYRSTVTALEEAKRERKERALAQVDALLTAEPGGVPNILVELERRREDVLPHLLKLWENESDQKKRMRVALALLPVESTSRSDQLSNWMITLNDPAEILLLRDVLFKYKAELTEKLWKIGEDATGAKKQRFHALVALAQFDPQSTRWAKVSEDTAGMLMDANPFYQMTWVRALKPVREKLREPLGKLFREAKSPVRVVAATILADYYAEQEAILVDLILDADSQQYTILLPVLKGRPQDAVEQRLDQVLDIPAVSSQIDSSKPVDAAKIAQWRITVARQANAALTLLHLGKPDKAWQVFRHGSDPEARSWLVWRCADFGLDPRILIRRLDVESDVSTKRALILALGEYGPDALPPVVRALLVTKLLHWYRHDKDAGLHSAIDWLLRHGKEGPNSRPLYWRQEDKLREIDVLLRRRDPDGDRHWYVNGQGQTLSCVLAPPPFRMGSPISEKERKEFEWLHWRRIGRSFAIASKPVTMAQFRCYLADREEQSRLRLYGSVLGLLASPGGFGPLHAAASGYPGRFQRGFVNNVEVYGPDPECPINTVSWFEAVKYCRWLSEKEGIAKEDMVYPSIDVIERCEANGEPFPLSRDYLKRTGYRLPTEAEWEFACRAGSATSRSFGDSLDLLPRYAWYMTNSEERTWPVGQKRPNDLGIFDMPGTLYNWCGNLTQAQPGFPNYKPGTEQAPDDDEPDLPDKAGLWRMLRGGSFSSRASNLRSAYRDSNPANAFNKSVGFRLARTLP